MRRIASDVRLAGWLGMVMAAWVSVFIFAGTIGAFFGAPQSHSPLFITLLSTSLATAIVSLLTGTLEARKGEVDLVDDRAVATFAFVNSAGTLVGLITNLSQSAETWELAEQRNGLTFLYSQLTGHNIPVPFYLIFIFVMIIVATVLVIRGARILSSPDRPSDEELQTLAMKSGSMLAFWIFTCMRWEPLTWGAEAVATTWTIVVYLLILVVAVVIYGFAGVRIAKSLSRAAFNLGKDASSFLSDPKTWRMLGMMLAAMCFFVAVAGVLYFALLAIISASRTSIDVATDVVSSQTLNSYADSYWEALKVIGLWFASLLGVVGLFLSLWMVKVSIYFACSQILNLVRKARLINLRHLLHVRFETRSLHRTIEWLGRTFGWVALGAARLVSQRSNAIGQLLVTSVPMLALLTASTRFYEVRSDERPEVSVVMPLPDDVSPLHTVKSIEPTRVTLSPTILCEPNLSATEWEYASADRITIDLKYCKFDFALEHGDTLVVVAMSTLGKSKNAEELRSRERLRALMRWAAVRSDSGSKIYGVDLGMANSPQSHVALSRLFRVSVSERPLVGMIASSSDIEISSAMLREALSRKLREYPSIASAYSKCEIYETAGGIEAGSQSIAALGDCGLGKADENNFR